MTCRHAAAPRCVSLPESGMHHTRTVARMTTQLPRVARVVVYGGAFNPVPSNSLRLRASECIAEVDCRRGRRPDDPSGGEESQRTYSG